MLTPHIDTSSVELITQHTSSHEGMLQVQFIKATHQGQFIGADGLSLIVDAASANAGQLGLLFDRKRMGAVNYLFALSNPTLVSALSKKSFSNVSCPILACRAFTSTGGPADLA